MSDQIRLHQVMPGGSTQSHSHSQLTTCTPRQQSLKYSTVHYKPQRENALGYSLPLYLIRVLCCVCAVVSTLLTAALCVCVCVCMSVRVCVFLPAILSKLQRERIWTRVLEKVFEGGGIGEEVPGYGAELRLEDHCLSADGVRLFVFLLYDQDVQFFLLIFEP